MGSQDGEDSWQGGGLRTGAGKVVAGRLGEDAAGGAGGPTFACE